MSYGYYRVGSDVDPHRARQRLADAMIVEASRLTLGAPPAHPPIEVRASPAAPADMDVGPARMSRDTAHAMGYTGDSCSHCGSMKMQHTGHCNTCAECGTTTGCS